MPSRNAVTFSGNFSPLSAISSIAPFRQDANGLRVQALDLFRRQLAGQQHRRHLRGVEDLVRIGVADAAEQMRIRQRALQGVVLAASALRRTARTEDCQHFQAAGIVRRELVARRARGKATRGASSRLRSGSAIRYRSRMPRRPTLPGIFAPRSSQRKRPAIIRWMTEKQLAFELPDQALAQSSQIDDGLAVCLIDGRIDRPNEKGTGEPNPLEPAARDARAKRMQVQLDVWKFGQLLGVEDRGPAGWLEDDSRRPVGAHGGGRVRAAGAGSNKRQGFRE